MGRKPSIETIIEEFKLIHGDKYDYSQTIYINSTTPVKIICPVHGEFFQIPSIHLNKKNIHECPQCGKVRNQRDNQKRKEIAASTFIERASLIYENKYSYSKSIYKGAGIRTEIICPVHGSFLKNPHVI